LLQAPLDGTTPTDAVEQEDPEHLQVDSVSPGVNVGGTALLRHDSTVLPAVQSAVSPHTHTPVASLSVHRFPV